MKTDFNMPQPGASTPPALNIPAALVDIHAKLVDKLGGQPTIATAMHVSQRGCFSIQLYPVDGFDRIARITCDNAAGVIGLTLKYIANMVSKEQRRVNAWQQGLADVIDEGHDLNLPDNVLAPLRASSQAMTENLLTVAK